MCILILSRDDRLLLLLSCDVRYRCVFEKASNRNILIGRLPPGGQVYDNDVMFVIMSVPEPFAPISDDHRVSCH